MIYGITLAICSCVLIGFGGYEIGKEYTSLNIPGVPSGKYTVISDFDRNRIRFVSEDGKVSKTYVEAVE